MLEQANKQAIGQAQGAVLGGENIARGDRNAIGCKGSLGFTFSEALERIKNGQHMRRNGWNGYGMRVFLWRGEDPSKPHERASHLNGIRSDLFDVTAPGNHMAPIRVMPYFRLVTPEGHVSTWVPSVTDLLAEDWNVA